MSLREAIDDYHSLLTDDLGAETQAQLDDQLQRRGLLFGERKITTVLRPRFLTPELYRYLQDRVRLLMRAFAKIHEAAVADPGFRKQFGLLDWEEELVQHDPGFKASSPTGRLDAFFSIERNQLLFNEYNAETPAAPGYNEVLSEVFLGLPAMREFLRGYNVRTFPGRHNVMHCLLDAFHQWCGAVGRSPREAPQIAILDWREVPTYSEFVLFNDYFHSQGLESRIVDPREVEYRDGKLTAGDYPITLIYKRVLIGELVERGGLDHPGVRAVRDGAVCMVNPFRCKILYKKASLAVLSDERNQHLFSADEQAVVSAHIPWTRWMSERKTEFQGQPIDLVSWVIEHKDRLVLKPNDDYGGKGIVLGWEVDAAQWADAVKTALSTPYIVQDRISLPSEPYPSFVDGNVQIYDRMLDTAPFVYNGEYMDGCLTRLSTVALLNVTAGGGSTVPTFVVEKR